MASSRDKISLVPRHVHGSGALLVLGSMVLDPYNSTFYNMENLWAPWRMEYITGKREEGCIFCTKPPQRDRLKENYILHVGRFAFVILNRFPYHSGHLMVIPLRHTDDFENLTSDENAELCTLLQASVRALKQEYEKTQARLESLLERWESMAVV